MSKLRSYVEEIYKLAQSNPFAVYDKYFTEDSVVVDMDGSETVGKTAIVASMQNWVSKVTDEGTSKLISYVVSGDEMEGMVVSIWHYTFEHQEMGKMDYKQASITHWKNGKVYREQFIGDFAQ